MTNCFQAKAKLIIFLSISNQVVFLFVFKENQLFCKKKIIEKKLIFFFPICYRVETKL